MRTRIIGMAVVLAALFFASFALAGPRMGYRGSGGWGMGSQYQRLFNPATVETVSGTVVSVNKVMPFKGMRAGVHLTVKTANESIDVHLGPEWYIERLDTQIEKGDAVEVKGSRVVIAGKPAVIAAQVKKGGNVLVLRDENGIPAWAGWRR